MFHNQLEKVAHSKDKWIILFGFHNLEMQSCVICIPLLALNYILNTAVYMR